MILIPQDTFTEKIISDINNLLNIHADTFRYITFKNMDCLSILYNFTYCLGGVGITFACNGSVTIDWRGLPAPSLSTVSEIWPVIRNVI